jgi:hypothetical protein
LTEDTCLTAPDDSRDIRACVDFPAPEAYVSIPKAEYVKLLRDSKDYEELLARMEEEDG